MATITSGRPPVFNLPNQLTAARLVLGVILFVLIALQHWWWCVFVFGGAAATDWLDGYLARKQGMSTALGRLFDPLVDKIVICGAFIFLLSVADASGLAPWMVTIVVSRELIITGLRSFIENRGVDFGADWLGKLKMALQCAALFAIFVGLSVETDHHPSPWGEQVLVLRDGLIYAMLGATALSGLQYLWRAATLLHSPLTGEP
jgi:CDP-diacylglycerol--glycerol-3-phosphate 3-phosphatidyltransferase